VTCNAVWVALYLRAGFVAKPDWNTQTFPLAAEMLPDNKLLESGICVLSWVTDGLLMFGLLQKCTACGHNVQLTRNKSVIAT
jgi:hypothetical protein